MALEGLLVCGSAAVLVNESQVFFFVFRIVEVTRLFRVDARRRPASPDFRCVFFSCADRDLLVPRLVEVDPASVAYAPSAGDLKDGEKCFARTAGDLTRHFGCQAIFFSIALSRFSWSSSFSLSTR